MMNLLFSPNGRMNSGEFMKAAIILIVVGIALSLPDILGLGAGLSSIASILAFLLIIPWIFIWIKRYRDGGKPGVMCLLPIAVYILGAMVLMFFMMGDVFGSIMQTAAEGGTADQAEMEAMMKSKVLPVTIASAVWSFVVAFLFNSMIKTVD